MRTILHADMDAFYASIEQREDPSLVGKPVIVGAVSERGVVAAASYEARTFGVRSAMPAFRARELCPHGVFLPSNMKLYVEVSDQVHAVFEQFTSEIEPLALDEAFLDVTGSVKLFGGARALATELKRRVHEHTALRVSVGLAPSKLVAKMACTAGKPDGLRVVEPEEVGQFLETLPIRALWGVGPVTEQALARGQIRTLGDIVRCDLSRLTALVGDRAATLQQLARGEDTRQVRAERAAKSYGEESTFSENVLDRQHVLDALNGHAEAVARRIRRSGLLAKTVTLKIKLGRARGRRVARGQQSGQEPDYPLLTRSKSLRAPTDDAVAIRDVALALWDQAGVQEPVRLLGIAVSNFTASTAQLDLFAATVTRAVASPHRAVSTAMDAIRDKFGTDSIFRGAQSPEKMTHSSRRKAGD